MSDETEQYISKLMDNRECLFLYALKPDYIPNHFIEKLFDSGFCVICDVVEIDSVQAITIIKKEASI
jgi:hypothetical protein